MRVLRDSRFCLVQNKVDPGYFGLGFGGLQMKGPRADGGGDIPMYDRAARALPLAAKRTILSILSR